MKLRKLATLALGAVLVIGLTACADTTRDPVSSGGEEAGGLIGISMPTKSLERWNNDGANLEARLKEFGYETTLQYADDKVDMQISQLQNMINQNVKVLVIAAINGEALAPVLKTAADAGIKIVAYDRLINGTENVDYYATFDNYLVGKYQGEFIEEALDLKNAAGPFNIEPFAGSPDDNNAKFFFSGAWDVLSPYVESGKLVSQSGKAPATNDDWASIGIQGWKTDSAQSEMQNRINSFYTGSTKVDVVLSPNDSLALGIAQALDTAGYNPDVDWPVLTGQDADIANVKNILAGKQSMSVWKDTRTLGDQVAKMVDQMLKGETVDVNDTTTYHNGVKQVPSYLLPPEVVVKDTVEEILVGKGYYTKDQIGL
ncbi:MAG: sugar-binding protein [Propionibacteriaceae bacterium]|jgi:putative multiple sugar transport system substrate-binding protein|nr:sugar-binding protein [Propionibacteriaceae bacterium]